MSSTTNDNLDTSAAASTPLARCHDAESMNAAKSGSKDGDASIVPCHLIDFSEAVPEQPEY